MNTHTSRRAMLAGTAAIAVTSPTVAIASPSHAHHLPTYRQVDGAYDRVASLKRAEDVIGRLRTRVICDGWVPDLEGGERVLRHLRRDVAEPAYDTEEVEFKFAIDFFARNGQSLDWIFRGEPGGMICALAARSSQAAFPGDDPVYAAIEAYKAANAFLCECIDKEAEIDERIRAQVAPIVERRMKTRVAFEAANPDHQFTISQDEMRQRIRYEEVRKHDESPDYLEKETLMERGHAVDREANIALLTTVPTTEEGAAALVAFIREREENTDEILGVVDDAGTRGDILLVMTLDQYFQGKAVRS